jgi:hypothetical protein
MRLKRRKTAPSSPPLAPPHLPHLFAPLGRHNLYTSAQRFGSSSLTQEQQKEEEKEKGAKQKPQHPGFPRGPPPWY